MHRAVYWVVLVGLVGVLVYAVKTDRSNAPTMASVEAAAPPTAPPTMTSTQPIRPTRQEPRQRPKSPWAEIDDSPTAQRKRQSFIQNLTEAGVFYKIEKRSKYARVYVGSAFYGLPIDDKKSFLSVVLAYYYAEDSEADILILRNHLTGKDIGRLDQYGLHLDY
jgi:hypothetical protein